MPPTGPTPVTSKQRRMLAFFGCAAKDAAEAHRIIAERLADPVDGRRWLLERARMVLAKCPDLRRSPTDPQDSHAELFRAAAALVHGFALEDHEARPLLREYANRSDQPWSDHEVDYKLKSARNASHKEPRGHMIGEQSTPAPARADTKQAPKEEPKPRPQKVTYDPAKLRTLSEKWREVVNLPWLADRSAIDPALVTSADFLRALYPAGEKILTFDVFKSQGQALWPAEPPPAAGPDGVWFLPQPVTGETLPNPRTGKMSRRSEESVVEFRYLVLESDQAEPRDWLGFLVRLPLKIEAIYTSAGRSIHALVRVNCVSKAQFDAFKARLAPMLNLLRLGGVDDAVFSCVRLTRLPGAYRAGKLQKLLYLRPGASARPICDLPPVRDVVAYWRGLAAPGPADSDETGAGARQIRAALEYYARTSRPMRESLHHFNQACRDAGFDCDQTER